MDAKKRLKRKIALSLTLLATFMLIFSVISVTSAFSQEGHTVRELSEHDAKVASFGLFAAAIAFGLGAMGAGIGIANVGAAAMGTIGEKPEVAGQALIFIALAEGLVIFGFITALMILGKLPL